MGGRVLESSARTCQSSVREPERKRPNQVPSGAKRSNGAWIMWQRLKQQWNQQGPHQQRQTRTWTLRGFAIVGIALVVYLVVVIAYGIYEFILAAPGIIIVVALLWMALRYTQRIWQQNFKKWF